METTEGNDTHDTYKIQQNIKLLRYNNLLETLSMQGISWQQSNSALIHSDYVHARAQSTVVNF